MQLEIGQVKELYRLGESSKVEYVKEIRNLERKVDVMQ